MLRHSNCIPSLHFDITNNFMFVPENKKQKSIMADIDCSRRTNIAEKRTMTTPKEMDNLRGKSKDHDPKSPHPDRIQQKHKEIMKHQCKVSDIDL